MLCDHQRALDLAKQGQWDQAHTLIQACSDELSCLIHAYLHRLEGDISNARYWYRRAGVAMPDNNVEEELIRLYALIDKR